MAGKLSSEIISTAMRKVDDERSDVMLAASNFIRRLGEVCGDNDDLYYGIAGDFLCKTCVIAFATRYGGGEQFAFYLRTFFESSLDDDAFDILREGAAIFYDRSPATEPGA